MAKRIAVLLALGAAAVLVLAPTVQAQTTHALHPYYSNSRAQIGNGLPIPITFAPAPYGRIRPVGGATVMQGTVGSQPSIMISPTQLSAPVKTLNIGVWNSNKNVFQVQTSLSVRWPGAAATLAAGSAARTGPNTVTWCPGIPVPTAVYNPACSFPTPSSDPRNPTINSALRYQAVANQFAVTQKFGGVVQGAVGGGGPTRTTTGGPGTVVLGKRGAVVALKAGINPPCTGAACVVLFDTVVAAQTAAQGAAFGFKNSTAGTPLVSPGVFRVSALGVSSAFPGALGGTITAVNTPLAPQPASKTNGATSWGGPLTTGMVTILAQNTANLGTESFTLTGNDYIHPTNGTRLISLVSGAVSTRTLSLPNANRGWVTLHLPEPGALLGTMGALLALLGCHSLTRRRH